MDWQSGTIAIIGVERTGRACAEVLHEHGLSVRVYERASYEEKQAAVDQLRQWGIPVQTGQDIPDEWDDLSLVIPSPGIRPEHRLFEESERHGVPVWSEIEVAYRIASAPIIAVTGTNGKSTTTALIYRMLVEGGQHAWLCGNIAGAGGIEMPLIQAAHQASKESVLVAEVSSFQLDRTVEFRPRIAVLTNVDVDHLDYHKSWEHYARAKGKLFRAQTSEDWAVLNADDAGTARLLEMLRQDDSHGFNVLERDGRLIRFSREEQEPNESYLERTGDDIRLHIRTGAVWDQMSLPRRPYLRWGHNLSNVLAATSVASLMGGVPRYIYEALKSFDGLPHRMEFVAEKNSVIYINNSMCTNAAALESSLRAIDRPCIAIVGGVEKSGEVDRLADAIQSYCHYAFLIGKSAGSLETALRARRFTRFERVNTLDKAVPRAQAMAAAGDVVILAPGCASQDQFRNFEERGQAFINLVMGL